jgi:hypothetical protein
VACLGLHAVWFQMGGDMFTLNEKENLIGIVKLGASSTKIHSRPHTKTSWQL